MKYLIISEYYSAGGAEQIARQQMKLLRQCGHEVRMLCFNYSEHHSRQKPHLRDVDFFNVPFFLKTLDSRLVARKLRRYLMGYDPDSILVHNVFSSPISVFRALGGWNVVQIIHDVYCMCPNTLGVLLDSDWAVCDCRRGRKCIDHCGGRYGKAKMCLKLHLIDRMNAAKAECKVRYTAPSKWIVRYLQENGFEAEHIPNPVELTDVPSAIVDYSSVRSKRFCYVGGVETRKGCFDVCKAFKRLEGEHSLTIFGRAGIDEEMSAFERALMDDSRIEYAGQVSHDDLLKRMKDFDFLVVPSKWLENYPTSVLDAFSTGTVVVGADRGGISELLSDGCGLLYPCGDVEELFETLSYCSSDMSQDEYSTICSNAYNKLIMNNNPDDYILSLEKFVLTGDAKDAL